MFENLLKNQTRLMVTK